MRTTIIVVCPKCKTFLMAIENQKTKTCTCCSSRIELDKTEKVAFADDPFAASEILRKLKIQKRLISNSNSR